MKNKGKIYIMKYTAPPAFSDLFAESTDGVHLTSLVFEGSTDCEKLISGADLTDPNSNLPVFDDVRRWLDIYFGGGIPDFTPNYKIGSLTDFSARVTLAMNEIPYGETVTYGEIARKIACEKGLERMSAQAVGGAVGRNPICIIVPCHRVVGAGGKIVGYGGGIENKKALLALEADVLGKSGVIHKT